VGDNPDSEIEAGNRLGIVTVQILRPEVPRGHNATHVIHGLAELKALIQRETNYNH
jgi:putative hydrolase of the HAD superfamily